jgi:hypothetical protein
MSPSGQRTARPCASMLHAANSRHENGITSGRHRPAQVSITVSSGRPPPARAHERKVGRRPQPRVRQQIVLVLTRAALSLAFRRG